MKFSSKRVCTSNPNAIQQRYIPKSHNTPYRKISRSLEAARSTSIVFRFLCNLRGVSAGPVLRRLSNFLNMRQFELPNLQLRDLARSAAIPLLVLITGRCHFITTGIEERRCHAIGTDRCVLPYLVVKTWSCLPVMLAGNISITKTVHHIHI